MAEKHVFSFLRGNGEEEETSLTYQALDERARAIAGELQALAPPEERALLLFPPGLDFITAFFGCLYAGIVAVPAPIPNRNRLTTSVEAIFKASRPSLVLSTADHREQAKRTYARHAGLAQRPWIAVDRVGPERQHAWRDPQIGDRQIAFLQYTSGSTSLPKGVMLSHRHLLCNAALIQEAFHTTTESHAVFWLPLYHDMGLIGGVIQPVYCGGSSTLMAPATFLQRPALWLETISRTRATVSGGPDFAYDLCTRKISAEERAGLDLSCWELAFLGAERIRPQTVEQFLGAFAPAGSVGRRCSPATGWPRPRSWCRAARGKLRLSFCTSRPTRWPATRSSWGRPRTGPAASWWGAARTCPASESRSSNPQTHLAVTDGHVGEIWVQGPSVADGYYENPQATAATFQARLARAPSTLGPGRGEGPFLRTGDLGFILQKQLFVTGRLKNLIIIRGRNHYPEDIEQTINSAYEGLRVGYCAAFSIEVQDHDQLVVVQEVEPRRRDLDSDAAIQAIRTAIADRHELEVHAVILVKAGSVPKTSSGKTRRAACRERYLRGELEILAAWKAPVDEAEHEPAEAPPAGARGRPPPRRSRPG